MPEGTRILSVLELCNERMAVIIPSKDGKLGHRIVPPDRSRYAEVSDMEVTGTFSKSKVAGLEDKLMRSHERRVDTSCRRMTADEILLYRGEMLRKSCWPDWTSLLRDCKFMMQLGHVRHVHW